MTKLTDLTTSQLNQIIAIKEQIETLQGQIDSIVTGGEFSAARKPGRPGRMSRSAAARIAVAARWAKARATKGKRRLSAAGRAAIIAGTKARWARLKAAKKKDRRSSPAVRAKLAAAAKARWARVKAEGKTTL